MTDREGSMAVPRGDGSRWWLVFLAASALLVVSALSTPLMGAPDEPAHSIKAVAVARGDLTTGFRRVEAPGGFGGSTPVTDLRVPRAYGRLRPQWVCWATRQNRPASCAPELRDRAGTVEAGTYVGTYPPLYYGVVGLPSRFLAPRPALYAMRIVSALVVAMLLATAVTSIHRASDGRLAIAGVALAVTPTVIFLGGALNPNGVEIAAAIALWCALLELLSDAQRVPGRRMALRLGLPAGLLAFSRPLSPALLVVIVGLVLVVLGEPVGLRERWRSRPLRIATAAVAACVVLAVVYLLVNRSLSAFIDYDVLAHRSVGDVLDEAPERTGPWVSQMVAMLGWLGRGAVFLPKWAERIWLGATVLLAAGAVVAGRTRARIAVALLVAGTLVLPVVAEVANRGVGWQGRYALPLAVGLPIVAGWALDQSGRVRPVVERVLPIVVVALAAVVQVVAHQRYMTRVVVGLPNGLFDSLGQGTWNGPLTPVVLLVASVLASVAFAVALLAGTQREDATASAGQGPAG